MHFLFGGKYCDIQDNARSFETINMFFKCEVTVSSVS